MLKRLKLHAFRYIEPGTELVFAEGFNVLLGKNGTGKTTLLDLISVVLTGGFYALRNEAFDVEYEFLLEHGTALFRFENRAKAAPPHQPGSRTAARARSYVPRLSVQLRRDDEGPGNRFDIQVEAATMRWRVNGGTWEGDSVVDVFESSLSDALAVNIPYLGPENQYALILDEAGPSGWFAHRFDESLGLFETITTHNPSDPSWSGRVPWFMPARYRAQPEPRQLTTNVEIPSDSSLAKFPGLANIKHMSMIVSIDREWEEPDGTGWSWGAVGFLFAVAARVAFSHHGLSYGQKRLLSFLYYLDANPRYVVADELVNGMHHEWIRACLDEIGARQAFLTSQNPLLLDFLPLESAEQARKTFIQCRTQAVDGEPRISWSNLSAEDAAELFADHQVGIQPVGEILRARGLW